MDRTYIEQNDIVIRYVRGELSSQEAEAFEIYYLDKPELVEEVRINRYLHEGARSYVARKHQSFSKTNTSRWLSWLTLRPSGLIATVYSLCIFAFGVGFAYLIGDMPSHRAPPDYLTPSLVRLEDSRSTNTEPFLLSQNQGIVLLLLTTSTFSDKSYDFELVNSEGKTVFVWDDVKPQPTGEFALGLEPSRFEPGRYRVSSINALAPSNYELLIEE